MNLFEAIILAFVEGLTEFLPVSSTGHLIIASSIMGISSSDFTKTFNIAIQFGAILSVVVAYRDRFFKSLNFYWLLLIALFPSAILGLLLNSWIDGAMERVDIVGYGLLIGGIILLFVDQWFKKVEFNEIQVTPGKAFVIGIFQCLAVLLPGVSRSASTIIGGLTQKLGRKKAAEFSFLLAVPTMFAAAVYKLYIFFNTGNSFESNQLSLLLVGNLVAFIIAWFAIKGFINFLSKQGFRIFGIYRIILGSVILTLYYLGYEFSMM